MEEETKKFIENNEEMLYKVREVFNKSGYQVFSDFISDYARKILLVTEDGLEIYDQYQYVYGVTKDWKTDKRTVQILGQSTAWKWYSSSELRRIYIDLHKPKTTVAEQIEAVRILSFHNRHMVTLTPKQLRLINEALLNLSKSKP